MLCCDSNNKVIGTLPGKIQNMQGMVVIEMVDEVKEIAFQRYDHQISVLTRETVNLPVISVQRMYKVPSAALRDHSSSMRLDSAPAEEVLAGLARRGAVPMEFLTFVETSSHLAIRQDYHDMGFTFTATQLLAQVSDDLSEKIFDLPSFVPV